MVIVILIYCYTVVLLMLLLLLLLGHCGSRLGLSLSLRMLLRMTEALMGLLLVV